MPSKTWRAKYVHLPLTPSRHLLITLRRFHTNKARRSKHVQQLVLPLRLGKLKEIAIKPQFSGKKRRLATPSKTSGQWQQCASHLLLVVGLSGILFCSAEAVQVHALEPPQTFTAPVQQINKPAPVVVPYSLPASQPTAISIPAQTIAAPVISVGQASDGSIQTPPLFDWSVGWYDKSPLPGQIGPSVIVGHVDTYKGISVFWRLRYLQPGDTILVNRADGSTATFAVDSLQQFDQSNFPTQEVYGNIDYAGLRLITCGGSFDTNTESYTQNTVVFAHLIK